MATHLQLRGRFLAGIVAVSALLVSGLGGTAAASAPTPRWTLEDYQQSGCFSSNVHDHYFGVYIDGRWRRQINVGAAHLPAGGTYDTSYAPIPPGSSNGEY